MAVGTPLPLDLSRNPIIVNVPAWDIVNLSDRSGLMYYLEIYAIKTYGTETFELIETLEAREKPKVVDGSAIIFEGAYFDVSKLLDALLFTTKPDFNQTGVKVCDGMVRAYYCKAIIKNNDVTVNEISYPTRYVLKGGVEPKYYDEYRERVFTDYLGVARKFLSTKTFDSEVRADQPEHLYFLTHFADVPTEINLRVYFLKTDGSSGVQTLVTYQSLQVMNVYCIAVGVKALGLAADVVNYSVWLTDENDERVSELRTYWIDRRFRHEVNYFLFESALGNFETFITAGDRLDSVEIEAQEGQVFTGYGYEAELSDTSIQEVRGRQIMKINTGAIVPAAYSFVYQLMFSEQIFMISERSHLPVALRSRAAMPYNSVNDMLRDETVTFTLSKEVKNVFELPILSSAAQRLTAWRPIATACELDGRGRFNGLLKVTLLELFFLDNNTAVSPRKIKANIAGEAGYIPAITSSTCSVINSPFLSAAISRQGTFVRATCAANEVGGFAIIAIAAGAWGSNVSQADADAKAEAEWLSLNTQAYADSNGSCSAFPQNYVVTVPSGRFWIRLNSFDTQKTAGTGISASGSGYRPGNVWFNNNTDLQPNQTDVYPENTWDVGFPVLSGPGSNYDLHWYLKSNNNVLRTMKIYVNGALVQTETSSEWFKKIAFNAQFVNGDKVYIAIT